jgi:23S rRNA pseudouridine2605 synthase
MRWEVTLRQGHNREVRNIMAHLGLRVSALERVSFGPYELGWLQRGDALRVPLKKSLRRMAGADWDWER